MEYKAHSMIVNRLCDAGMDENGVGSSLGHIVDRLAHVGESFDWSDGYSMVHGYHDRLPILSEYSSESAGFSGFHLYLIT